MAFNEINEHMTVKEMKEIVTKKLKERLEQFEIRKKAIEKWGRDLDEPVIDTNNVIYDDLLTDIDDRNGYQ